MDVSLLRTFLAVYRTGSVTGAAKAVHLTQPAVSMQIQALERRLGQSLFRRMPRGMQPTPAGDELARSIGPHLDALEESMGLLGSSGDLARGAVFIGGPSEFVTARVLPVLGPLLDRGLKLRVFLDTDGPIVERLEQGELDLAIITRDLPLPSLALEPLYLEKLVLVGSPEWRERVNRESAAANSELGAVEIFERAPLLAHGEDLPLLRAYWTRAFARPLRVSATVVVNSLPSLLALTCAGVGITVLPDHVCAEALRTGALVPLHEPDEPPHTQLRLAWRSGSLRSAGVSEVHERIVAASVGWREDG